MGPGATDVEATGMIPQVPASVLKGPEDAHLPVAAQGMSSDLDNLAGSVNSQIKGLFPQIVAAEKQKAASAQTDATAEAAQLGKYRDNLAKIWEEDKPSKVNIPDAPKQPEEDTLKNFGSIASMIGVFASAFTKKPAVNALNASAAAMNAQRQGDKEKFDEAYKDWQAQVKLTMERHELEVENLNQIMDFAKEDQTAALAQLKAYGVAHNSSAASVLAELGDWEEIGKYVSSMEQMKVRGQEATARLQSSFAKQQTDLQKQQVYKDTFDSLIQTHPNATPQQKAAFEAQAVRASQGKTMGIDPEVKVQLDELKSEFTQAASVYRTTLQAAGGNTKKPSVIQAKADMDAAREKWRSSADEALAKATTDDVDESYEEAPETTTLEPGESTATNAQGQTLVVRGGQWVPLTGK